jgi:hypothetical protein
MVVENEPKTSALLQRDPDALLRFNIYFMYLGSRVL